MSNPKPAVICQPENDDEATFTCPICLFEKPAVYIAARLDANDGDIMDNADDADACIQEADGASCPIFQLSSCNHKFCTACLRAYVRSKLFDGEVDIPCCHFKLSSDEDDFHLCNVLLKESDVDQLLHGVEDDGDNESNARNELFCTSDDPCHDIFTSRRSYKNNNAKQEEIADQLWVKYQKLKFDQRHGRDAVRRCPSCDEARLFDEEVMKQYQSSFLTQESAAPIPDVPTTGKNMLRAFHRRQRETAWVADRNEQEVSIAVNADPRASKNTKDVDFPEPSDGIVIQTTVLSSIDNDEATSSSQDNGGVGIQPPLDSAKTPQDNNTALLKSTTPVVICQKCSTEFCYFHSNAHSGTESTSRMTCVEYHKKSLELDRANVDFATQILRAKPCPTCGISVSKGGGCNQIKCGSCGTHFCWLCGAIVDDGAFPEHFRWWNLRGCANLQLDENTDPLRCTIWVAKLMSGFQIIVLGIPAVVLTLVSMVLCPCFVPGWGTTNRERVVNCISFWGSFLSSLLMLPFTCLGMITLLALSCFVAALSSLSKILTPNNTWSHSGNTGANRQSNTNDPDDFMRELGSILDRMEEGRATLGD